VTEATIQDFHYDHRDPKTKLFCVSDGNFSTIKTIAEMMKCDILCAECHYKRTAAQRRAGEI
jgi:hypothetical protein